jgi:hypothetical protein
MTITVATKNRVGKYPKGMLMIKPTNDKAILAEWVRTEFNLPKSIGDICDQFFLRIWTGNYVMESIQDGVLHGRADSWIVHFQSTPEVVKSSSKVACSFREYEGKKYVVIKVWKGDEEGAEK